MTARLVLVCGLPGAGKTTLARRLEHELGAVRLCADEWMDALAIDPFDQTTRAGIDDQFWLLTERLLAFGQSVILESGFWTRTERKEKRTRAHELGAAVELRYLDLPLEERWRRIERRRDVGGGPAITYEQLASWDPLFEPPDDAELALFDH